MSILFSPKPSGQKWEIGKTSREFKIEAFKVFLLCVLFLLMYLVLGAALVGIGVLVGFLGVSLASEVPGFVTGMVAIGAIGMGVMLIYFFLMSLIPAKREPVLPVGEITRESEPLFYSFIEKISEETGAPRPKRIFLVDEVNAFVSYDSVFLSMFFPARKNLYIGLGLINACTISELKAVIAHEFGHFSQGSMRFGSYIFHFNQIAYKMLDNRAYYAKLERWANFSPYFAIFTKVNVGLIRFVQRLMMAYYKVLNKAHMSLSRQMEFHADAIAASVAGSSPLISCLYRMDLACASYRELLKFYNALIGKCVQPDNIYEHHLKAMQILAQRTGRDIKNGLPVIGADADGELLQASRIVVKDQWASHPSLQEREAALLKRGISCDTVDEPAWDLFQNAIEVQICHTERLYEHIDFPYEPVLHDVSDFELIYNEVINAKDLQPLYRGYYNSRSVEYFEVDLDTYIPEDLFPDDLFSDEMLKVVNQVVQLEHEIAVLDEISAEGSEYRSFDFDGIRYSVADASAVKAQSEGELIALKGRLRANDQQAFYIAKRNAPSQELKHELNNAFITMFREARRSENDLVIYKEMISLLSLLGSRLSIEQIQALIADIIQNETRLKRRISELLEDEDLESLEIFDTQIEVMEAFLKSEHTYFTGEGFVDEQFELMANALEAFSVVTTDCLAALKKRALDIQAALLMSDVRLPNGGREAIGEI